MNMDFIKPSGTDNFSIETQNENWDKAQTGFHKVAPGILAESEQGAMVTVNDSSANPMYATLHGATEQQTYSGKNLCDIGTKTGTLQTNIPIDYLEDGETYTLSCVITSTDTDSTKCALYKHTNPTTDTNLGSLVRDTRIAVTFTKVENDAFIRFYASYDYNHSVDDTITLSDIQIELGETATDYEKFVGGTASPNPSYPQEIHGVGESGVLPAKSTNANIFGGLPFAQALVDSGSTNVVLDTDAKTVTFGHKTASANGFLFGKFKENTQYTFILGVKSHEGSSGTKYYTNLWVSYTDGTTDYLVLTKTTAHIFVYVSKANKTVRNFWYYYADKFTTTLNYEQCGIFEGVITADEFEPYTETTADIPLSAPLYGGDYIRLNMDGSGELVRKMASVVYDGDETWVINQNCFLRSGFAKGSDVKLTAISTHFTGTTALKGWNVLPDGMCQNYDSAIGFKKSDLTTVDEWKSWLAENPITVVYELKEPEVTPITAEQIAELKKLRSFYHVTHATTDEGEISIEYIADTKRYIDNKFEELQNAILVSV